MTGRIAVAGAGTGGLVAAYILGKNGYTVDIYEKSKQKEVSYDWHDDVSPHVFEKVNIPIIDKKHYFKKHDWSFVTPDGKHIKRIHQDEEKIDVSMERRPLAEMLIKRLESYTKIHYESTVDGLILEKNKVKGIFVNGKKVYADLVIDSSGVNSVLRKQLPDSYNIQQIPEDDEVFHAYRAFFNRKPGSEEPLHRNKVYLKHLSEEGISWCILDESGQINVLVGRVRELSDETLKGALMALREDNDIIGDEVLRGGIKTFIPVRYPLSRMVGQGYVAVGDSAFMTIPMLGSGIASAMVAGKILGEVIVNARKNPFSVKNLWGYQVRVMKEFGAIHAGVDLLKRWLLTADDEAISYVISHNIVNEEDLKKASVGELIELSPKDIINKLLIGYKRINFLLELALVMRKAEKAKKLALKIPVKYKRINVKRWQKKFDKLFTG